MTDITISYQLNPVERKPEEQSFKFNCKKTAHNRIVEVEADSFAKAVCSGQSWYCGTFSGETITNAAIETVQALTLDIDDGLTLDKAYTRLYKAGITPAVIYPTFSYTEEKPKFRIVFFLYKPIGRNNIRKWDVLMDMLYTLFPEADPASRTISQMWYGTNKEPFCVNVGARLNEQALYNAFIERKWGEIDAKNRSRDWQSIAAQWGVHLTENGLPLLLPDEDGIGVSPQWLTENVAAEHMDKTPTGRTRKPKGTNGKIPERIKGEQTVKVIPIENWKDKARRISYEFFAGFESGKHRMGRDQRHFLLSNLSAIEGGRKYYFEILKKNFDIYDEGGTRDISHYEDEASRWLATYTGIMGWTDTIKGDMVDASMEYNNLFEAIYGEEKPFMNMRMGKISVEKATEELKRLLEKILSDKEKGVFAIKADTGLGKTQAYIDFIVANKGTIGRTLICVPTHNLKKEVADRFAEVGVEVCQLKKKPDVGDDCEDKADYWQALKVGYGSKAQAIWKKYFDKVKKQDFRHPKYQEWIEYDDSFQKMKHAQIVIITQDQSLYREPEGEFDYVIYDEDVCQKMIEIKNTTVRDVKDFVGGFPNQIRFREVLNQIEQANGGRRSLQKGSTGYDAFITPERANWHIDIMSAEMKAYKGDIPNTDVFSFMRAKSYTIDYNGNIAYSFVRELGYHGSTVIVLSATLSPLIFGKLTVGRQAHFYQITHIQNKGIIVQDISETCSKYHLEGNPEEAIKKIGIRCPDWKERYLITYKPWTDFFEERGAKLYYHNGNKENPMSFGNTEGINALKGQKLLIYGKFSFPEYYYLLWATALNIPIVEGGDIQCSQRITHNGYTFRLFTFQQEELRQIHLYLLEDELEQATGRGRAVRDENADVVVLCDFPLHNADKVFYRGTDIREGVKETPSETNSREVDLSGLRGVMV